MAEPCFFLTKQEGCDPYWNILKGKANKMSTELQKKAIHDRKGGIPKVARAR